MTEKLGVVALFLSMINIVGGFKISSKMLGLFKKKTDLPEYYEYYSIPALTALGTILYGSFSTGSEQVASIEGAGAAVACIAGINGLSNLKTARFGNALSIVGVSVGIFSVLGKIIAENVNSGVDSFPELALITAVSIGAGVIGSVVSDRVSPTELPQTVAAFHSLVGFAASLTAIGEYLSHGSDMTTGTLVLALFLVI